MTWYFETTWGSQKIKMIKMCLYVLQGDGWLWVTAHRTGEQGLVFKDLLTDLDENIDPNAVFAWFHRVLTKNEAVERLVQGKNRQLDPDFLSSAI